MASGRDAATICTAVRGCDRSSYLQCSGARSRLPSVLIDGNDDRLDMLVAPIHIQA
jgi:hypothetical protein